jgi:hypothetical protein
VFYIIFRFGKEFKHKKELFNSLEGFECANIIKNLWKLPQRSINRVKKYLSIHKVPFILLKKQREIERIRITNDNFQLGSLVLVAYSFPSENGSIRKRKHVSRLLKRSPYLRLTRNIYAWPQINFRRLLPQGSKILSPRRFVDSIKELGGETITIPRIKVDNNVALELLETIKDIRIKEFSSIELACKKLIQQLKESAVSLLKAKHSFNEIKIRFIQTKEICFFLKKVYKINIMKEYRKALRAINNCKKVLQISSKMPMISVVS